ncbi:MAG: tetratricopeptide repeat protein [Bauldia sp.]|nr:tetratricopeptide repeat protein [Bauldia sp.]
MIARFGRRLARFALPLAVAAAMAVAASPAGAQRPIFAPFSTSFSGNYLAGLSADTDGDTRRAAAFFSRALVFDPGNIALAEVALLLWLASGDVPEAIGFAESMARIDPGHEPARLTLTAEAFRTGDYAEAQEQLDALGGDEIIRLTSGLLYGWAEYGLGNVDEALAIIAGLEGPLWYEPFKAYHGALIAHLDGRPEALDLMAGAATTDTMLRPLESYARMLARSDQRDAAIELLRSFLGFIPNDPMALDLVARIEAGEEIEAPVRSAAAGAAEVFYGIASAIGGDVNDGISLPFLQLSRYLGPDTELPSLAVGELLQEAGRHEAAVEVLDAIDPASPLHGVGNVRAALSLEVLDRSEAAAERLVPVVAENPSSLSAVTALATIYRNADRYDDMIGVLTPAIESGPDIAAAAWRLRYLRGIAYERSGRWELAEADFLAALDLVPDQPDVLNYLGYSWIDRGENFEEGLALIERAVAQRPDAGYIIDSLGWAHYQLGNYQEAVAALERAARIEVSHPVVLDHLGDAYWQAGRRREAMYQWAHALESDPDDDLRAQVEEKLRSGLPENEPAK